MSYVPIIQPTSRPRTVGRRTGVWMEISFGFAGDIPASATAVCIALHERDIATYQHCDRVSRLSLQLGTACGLSRRELDLLRLAAAFHDVGKIGIPDRILKKTTALNAREWTVMKSHSVRSERIVLAAALDEDHTIARAVRHHHERFDGAGYPDRLAGEDIPFLSRIVAVADAFDAMSHRRYAATRSEAEIVRELQREAGRQHDAYLVEKFARIIERRRFDAMCRESMHTRALRVLTPRGVAAVRSA